MKKERAKKDQIMKYLRAGWNPSKIAKHLDTCGYAATYKQVHEIAREIGVRIVGNRNEMNVYF